MRRSIVFIAGMILVLAFGVQSGAQQPNPQNNPQYRQNDPRFQRNNQMRGDRRSFVAQLSVDLVRQAQYLSESSFEYFMGWNGIVSNQEQAILFKSEEFAAACRLFSKLVQDQTNYFRLESLRTNLYNASRYVAVSFRQLEEQMRLGGMQGDFNRMRRDGRPFTQRLNRGTMGPLGLAECRRILDRIESEFSSWR
jgi:hypothetical protein